METIKTKTKNKKLLLNTDEIYVEQLERLIVHASSSAINSRWILEKKINTHFRLFVDVTQNTVTRSKFRIWYEMILPSFICLFSFWRFRNSK